MPKDVVEAILRRQEVIQDRRRKKKIRILFVMNAKNQTHKARLFTYQEKEKQVQKDEMCTESINME